MVYFMSASYDPTYDLIRIRQGEKELNFTPFVLNYVLRELQKSKDQYLEYLQNVVDTAQWHKFCPNCGCIYPLSHNYCISCTILTELAEELIRDCSQCQGLGYLADFENCPVCNGSGYEVLKDDK